MRYEDEEEWDDHDVDEDFDDDSETEPTRDCPCCGFEMLEICVQCPSCGHYPSREDSQRSSQPRWIILGAILCLGVLLFWILMR